MDLEQRKGDVADQNIHRSNEIMFKSKTFSEENCLKDVALNICEEVI